MDYTVKQLADLAGVTPRTLRYYDQIGLLCPAMVGENGYRYYTEDAVWRLQQIMFYRELDFSLAEIQAILDDPAFDLLVALQSHKRTLQARIGQLHDLIQTVDRTLLHLQGDNLQEDNLERELMMAKKDLFVGFDEARQAKYEEEISAAYRDDELNESRQHWGSYSAAQRDQILREGEAIYREFASHIGTAPTHTDVQALVVRWHEHLHYFYTPTPEILRGLAATYATHPDFIATYTRIDPALPDFLRDAILAYCDQLPADK